MNIFHLIIVISLMENNTATNPDRLYQNYNSIVSYKRIERARSRNQDETKKNFLN